MGDKMKVREGNDGYSYPYTSPDLVVDENGKSNTSKFNDIDTQFKDIAKEVGQITEIKYIKSVNIFNKNKITLNKYWDVFENNGVIWKTGDAPKDSNEYFITELIPIKNGDTIKSNIRWFNFVYFNSNKEVTRCKTGGNQAELKGSEFTINGDLVSYIQITYLINNKSYDDLMITINNEMPSSYIGYSENVSSIQVKNEVLAQFKSTVISKDEINLANNWVRKDVYIKKTDTQEEILVKMLDAVKRTNCDVYFETNTYNFDTVFDLMKTKYAYTTAYELPIGGNCRYYFNGSTLIATKTSTDSNVIGNESLMGSRRTSGNYELYDGILIANDMVYCVHDEAQGSPIPYVRKYKNMRMKYNTISSTQEFRKCIGGGAGQKGSIIIENCVFECDNLAEVSYHGFQSNEIGSELNLTVSNCYFKHKLQFDSMYSNGKAVALVCGNSYTSEPVVGTNWEVYKVNNEIRTGI